MQHIIINYSKECSKWKIKINDKYKYTTIILYNIKSNNRILIVITTVKCKARERERKKKRTETNEIE